MHSPCVRLFVRLKIHPSDSAETPPPPPLLPSPATHSHHEEDPEPESLTFTSQKKKKKWRSLIHKLLFVLFGKRETGKKI